MSTSDASKAFFHACEKIKRFKFIEFDIQLWMDEEGFLSGAILGLYRISISLGDICVVGKDDKHAIVIGTSNGNIIFQLKNNEIVPIADQSYFQGNTPLFTNPLDPLVFSSLLSDLNRRDLLSLFDSDYCVDYDKGLLRDIEPVSIAEPIKESKPSDISEQDNKDLSESNAVKDAWFSVYNSIDKSGVYNHAWMTGRGVFRNAVENSGFQPTLGVGEIVKAQTHNDEYKKIIIVGSTEGNVVFCRWQFDSPSGRKVDKIVLTNSNNRLAIKDGRFAEPFVQPGIFLSIFKDLSKEALTEIFTTEKPKSDTEYSTNDRIIHYKEYLTNTAPADVKYALSDFLKMSDSELEGIINPNKTEEIVVPDEPATATFDASTIMETVTENIKASFEPQKEAPKEVLVVYHNGLLLQEGKDYSVSKNIVPATNTPLITSVNVFSGPTSTAFSDELEERIYKFLKWKNKINDDHVVNVTLDSFLKKTKKDQLECIKILKRTVKSQSR